MEAERVRRELAIATGSEPAKAIRALTDQLVSALVPLVEAEEHVVCPTLGADACNALKGAGKDVRAAIERLSIVADNAEAGHARVADARISARALKDAMSALDSLATQQRTAIAMLDQRLTAGELTKLDEVLRAAALAAREHTILVGQRAIPTTSSTVFRRRPDLGAPYATRVAEIERTTVPRQGGIPGAK